MEKSSQLAISEISLKARSKKEVYTILSIEVEYIYLRFQMQIKAISKEY